MITISPVPRLSTQPGSPVSVSCAASGRPQPLVIWMYENERTFLMPGEATEDFEVTEKGEAIVEAVKEEMKLVCLVVSEVGSVLARSKVWKDDVKLSNIV